VAQTAMSAGEWLFHAARGKWKDH